MFITYLVLSSLLSCACGSPDMMLLDLRCPLVPRPPAPEGWDKGHALNYFTLLTNAILFHLILAVMLTTYLVVFSLLSSS